HARWDQIIYGFYPKIERWRVNFALLLIPITLYLLTQIKAQLRYRLVVFLLINLFIAYLLYGGGILKVVPTELWGGLFLTIVLSVGSMICSFPLAILLALGRHSKLVIIKPLCVSFIEVIRGVPLISILFLAAVMFPLFVSIDIVIDNLVCVFIGITLFQAAYLSEVVRAGLNSVPYGQVEAAASLGMNYRLSMILVVLPQALRTAIPGIMNSFISLFKDTTLVLIIGIYDFLGIVQTATTDPRWLGTSLEAYLFCALVYWIFCFGMSRYSNRLEGLNS
ncbi:MAG TPA: amino acid ABC transporter permease, partial [Candidatus Berkiella sp.]|nr:amino acid ABC transporter permease [Candidatus Berkiella sp.]